MVGQIGTQVEKQDPCGSCTCKRGSNPQLLQVLWVPQFVSPSQQTRKLQIYSFSTSHLSIEIHSWALECCAKSRGYHPKGTALRQCSASPGDSNILSTPLQSITLQETSSATGGLTLHAIPCGTATPATRYLVKPMPTCPRPMTVSQLWLRPLSLIHIICLQQKKKKNAPLFQQRSPQCPEPEQ